jgi:Rrf2 family nitric oxide-sensitive transcriptional repressor
MQLTLFSDYALRIALYLATHEDRLVSIDEICSAYGISKNHLAKVVARLIELGVVASVRGRSGGLKLARSADDINVGRLVRETEPHMNLVECFDMRTNTCPIAPACGLKGVLLEAQQAFLQSLDGHTLAEFLPRRDRLIPLWVKKRRNGQV